MTPTELPSRSKTRAFGLIGLGVALLIALFCVFITAWFVYDIAFLAHSANDWGDPAGFDVFFTWTINVPGWLVALCLAAFIRPVRRGVLVAIVVLAVAEIVLLMLMPTALRMNKARHERAAQEMTRALEQQFPSGERPRN